MLAEPAERALALALLGFRRRRGLDRCRRGARAGCAPISSTWPRTFTGFYETCPVLKAPTDDLRQSRLGLCDLTARVLAQGLDLLGILAPDEM